MMNDPVMQRKLFRKTQARDKLREIGGIMSSSPELMTTVAKYQTGGSIYANVSPANMITSIQDFLSSGDAQSGVGQIQEENALRRAGITRDDLARLKAQVTPEDLRRIEAATTANRLANAAETASMMEIPEGNLQPQISNIQSQLSDLGGLMTPQQRADSAAVEARLQEEQSGRLADEILGGSLEPDYSDFRMPGTTPAPDVVTEEEGLGIESGETSDLPGEETPPPPPEEKQAPETITDVMAQGNADQVASSLKDLMAEFTSNAPEYKGLDKGMAIAKIGFAMAAGKSPDALTNIASALSDGADMFIKDKQERDKFNRQVKLSALQYGLTEVGKERAEQRLIDREGRALKTYIAEEDMVVNGRTVKKDDPFAISVDYIRKNGIPSGATTPELVKAAAERASAATDAVDELIKNGILSNKDGRAEAGAYQESVKNVIGAETAINLLEGTYIDVVDGKVTGGTNAFKTMLQSGADFLGIPIGTEFKSVKEAQEAMRFALQKAVPATVGSTQSANSISDRDVNLLITALFGADALEGGPFVFATQNEDIMAERIGRAINEIRMGQQSELANMQSIETRLAGMYAPGSSRQTGVTPAAAQLSPFQQQLYQAGFSTNLRPTGTTAGLMQVGVEDGIPVYDFSK